MSYSSLYHRKVSGLSVCVSVCVSQFVTNQSLSQSARLSVGLWHFILTCKGDPPVWMLRMTIYLYSLMKCLSVCEVLSSLLRVTHTRFNAQYDDIYIMMKCLPVRVVFRNLNIVGVCLSVFKLYPHLLEWCVVWGSEAWNDSLREPKMYLHQSWWAQ